MLSWPITGAAGVVTLVFNRRGFALPGSGYTASMVLEPLVTLDDGLMESAPGSIGTQYPDRVD